LIPNLSPGDFGLDYGSGPAPVLSELMAEEGFAVTNYDLHFANNTNLVNQKFDFLTCIETAEHFRDPKTEWVTIFNLVKRGGWLGIMTELLTESVDFSSWYYKGDPTHICYYFKETFVWLAQKFRVKASFYGSSIIIVHAQD
jgi:hypothetical protein